MASSASEVANKFRRAGDGVAPTLKGTINEASLRVKQIYTSAALGAGLSPGRMSGPGKKGARWGVRYDVKGEDHVPSLARFFGPVHLVNNPAKAYVVRTKRGRAQKRNEGLPLINALTGSSLRRSRVGSGSQALTTPYGLRNNVSIPARSGKNFFDPADRFARQESKRITSKALRQVLYYGGFREGTR